MFSKLAPTNVSSCKKTGKLQLKNKVRLIDSPETEGKILVGLDDSINTKVGKKIFGCEQVFDHAAKANQSDYPWAQNIVSVGLLKRVHARWACLFLDFRTLSSSAHHKIQSSG
jgi:hypothetical protein